MNKNYHELISLSSFEQRFEYLKLDGLLGKPTFGFDRYLNQSLYQSPEWNYSREKAIIRDDGCDLGIPDRIILFRLTVHHINPITIKDVELGRDLVFDLDNLICCAFDTHRALHFGNLSSLQTSLPIIRRKGDTCPWKIN